MTGNKAAFCFRSFDQEKKDKTETWFGAYKAFRWRARSTLISWENETRADIAYTYISYIKRTGKEPKAKQTYPYNDLRVNAVSNNYDSYLDEFKSLNEGEFFSS